LTRASVKLGTSISGFEPQGIEVASIRRILPA
jgi:hypothetical protein